MTVTDAVGETLTANREAPVIPTNLLLALASAGEAVTGLLLLLAPRVVVGWLLGAEIAGAGVAVGRIAGMSLIALGAACWPAGEAGGGERRALSALLVYSALVAVYLATLGIEGVAVGRLLWPAVALHAALSILVARAWMMDPEIRARKQ